MKNDVWYVLSISGQLGFIIAIPVAILAYLGHLLDVKFHTSPLFILSGMGISICISSLAVYQMVKKIEKK